MEWFEKLKEDMALHTQACYPNEAVGIITKDREYIPCKNISSTPKETFFLDPAALVKHDGNIWGIFHSHPGSTNPIPSKEDKVSAAFQQFKFVVGFGNKFYYYWFDKALDVLLFEPLQERHFADNT